MSNELPFTKSSEPVWITAPRRKAALSVSLMAVCLVGLIFGNAISARNVPQWYFAELSRFDGQETYFHLLNPNATQTEVWLRFTGDTPDDVIETSLKLGSHQSLRVGLGDLIRREGVFSAEIAAARPVLVSASGAGARHGAIAGISMPQATWEFSADSKLAPGAHASHELYAIQNPNDFWITVRLGADADRSDAPETKVPPRGRASVDASIAGVARQKLRIRCFASGTPGREAPAPCVAQATTRERANLASRRAGTKIAFTGGDTSESRSSTIHLENTGSIPTPVWMDLYTPGGLRVRGRHLGVMPANGKWELSSQWNDQDLLAGYRGPYSVVLRAETMITGRLTSASGDRSDAIVIESQ